jgi:tetraacyldisaccharide-1-P 4'-kinase
MSSQEMTIITTEKDAQRLRMVGIKEQLEDLAIYYLPVEAAFKEPEATKFNNLIEGYASKSAGNN